MPAERSAATAATWSGRRVRLSAPACAATMKIWGVTASAFADLREFIDVLERGGELCRVPAPVDPDLEIAEIVDRTVKSGGPALLFERVLGSDLPLCAGLFASERRMAIALGVERVSAAGDRMRAMLGVLRRPPTGISGMIRLLPQLKPLLSMPPRRVSGPAPVQEVVLRGAAVDLSRLPLLRCWPADGGRFITLPQVITADPDTGARNVGVYRLQLHGPQALGLHWERHKGGAVHYARSRAVSRPLDVAVALGGDPVSIFAAGAPLPEGIDEFAFAGFLRGRPIELCRAVSVDLDVPARAEIVIEGSVDPEDLLPEGPFGDHTGFYDPGGPYPVLRVRAVTMRRDAIYPAVVVGRPPSEDHWLLGHGGEAVFLPLLQAVFPEIADLHVPAEGVANNLVLVSVKKRFPGHAYKVAYGLLGLGLLSLSKVVVVVDDWVSVQNAAEAWWSALCNCDPGRDVLLGRGPGSVLDHALQGFSFGGKMIIDGTRKWPEELGGVPPGRRAWPEPVAMDPAMVDHVSRRWQEYGLGTDPGPTGARVPDRGAGWSGERTGQ